MVRETRHLWIGNLPENIREEEIRDLFERYGHGRVQSVKLLSDENVTNNNGVPPRPIKNATVAFIDIRSASKALRNVRSIGGQPIHITYHEPGSVASRNSLKLSEPPKIGEAPSNLSDSPVTPCQNSINQPVSGNLTGSGTNTNCIPGSTSTGNYRQRFTGQHGQSEDTSSHFYDQPKSFSRGRGDGHFHGRGRRDSRPFHNRHSFPNDNRNYRPQWGYEGRYAPPAHSEVDDRIPPPVPSSTPHPPNSESSSKGPRRPESPASSVSSRHVPNKRHRSRSVSESGSTDRGSSAGSRSRSGSRSSVSSSGSSGRSPRSPPHHGPSSSGNFPRGSSSSGRFQHSYSRQRYSRSRVVNRSSESRVRHNSRSPMAASPSSSTSSSPSPHRKITAPHSPSHSPSSSKSYSPSRNINVSHHHHIHNQHHRRNSSGTELHAAIKIRNLPIRSSDTSLKDGLYHEYKKHGKVAWVRVCGSGTERFAIVCFKSAEHATRAVSSSQDKQFFGCKIQVTPYHHKSEDIVGASEEENKLVGEEEHASTGYPTRTVLITGLDAAVTTTELRSAFDQYGDIVDIIIRKQGTATHAVCEFVDIASAIRAQWGRHVFKSKEARISFYRNPSSTSLLLDGTAGVNEKQVYSHCCQYGAIKRIVMDPDRVLALIQFDEISAAQTAICKLRSWVIKGKHLQVDFASMEVIKIFLERVSAGPLLSTPESSSPSFNRSNSPSIGITKDRSIVRRIRSKDADDSSYRRSIELDDRSKLIIPTELPSGSDKFQELMNSDPKDFLTSGEDMNEKLSISSYRIKDGYTSPVSPDAEHSAFDNREEDRGKPLKSSSKNKIDLSCHETDSAIVTSSSDVIVNEKSEGNMNHGSSSSSVNGDDKLSSLEFDPARLRRKSLSSDVSHSAIVTVDGVSSTSPEPKPETVRKASPDQGIGCFESVPLFSGDTHLSSRGGLSDPRKKPNECKIRRSSADSGNTNFVCSSYMHSTTGSSSFSSVKFQATTTASVTSVDGNESDDNRPGTPLCDENPECFPTSENTTAVLSLSKPIRTQSFSLNIRTDPISLPLPEFALNRQRMNSNSSSNSKECPSSSIRLSRNSLDMNLRSPIKSPTSVSVLTSSSIDVDDGTPEVDQSLSSPFSIMKNIRWNDHLIEDSIKLEISNEENEFKTLKSTNECEKFENVSASVTQSKIVGLCSVNSVQEISAPSDPDSLASPSSPASATLEQRIQKCCEKYDRWNGNRANLSSSQALLVSNNAGLTLSMESVIPLNKVDLECEVKEIIVAESVPPDSYSNRFTMKHKFLDLEELRHQPSDIGRSVLARRSVFDEDSKRLENFGEKYEAKTCGTPGSVTNNWRVLALQRSVSTISNLSTGSAGSWQTPLSPATPLTPPVTSGSLFSSPSTTPVSRLSHPTSSSPVTTTPLLPSFVGSNSSSKTLAPHNVFQNMTTSQPMFKDSKDLILTPIQGVVTVKINSESIKTHPIVNTPTTLTPTESGIIVQPALGSIKKPQSLDSSRFSSKIPVSEKSNIIIKTPTQQPHQYPVTEENNISDTSGTLISNSLSSSNLPYLSSYGLQPMVHQGLPRAVERSLSLDSKKALITSNWNSSVVSSQQPSSGLPVNNVCNSKLSTINGSQGNLNVPRRSSVDSHSENNFLVKKCSPDNNSVVDQNTSEKIVEHSSSHLSSSRKIKESNEEYKTQDKMGPSNSSIKSENSKQQCQENDISSARKDSYSRKPELDFIKQEIMEMRPIHQETTVAVVASESSPFVQSRSDSSSTSRDVSSKKDKDRKNRSSGSSTPVTSSLNSNSTFINATKLESTTSQPSSSREKLITSRSSEDKNEKKDKESKSSSSGDSIVNLDDNQNVDCVNATSNFKKLEDKREKRDKKEVKDRDQSEHGYKKERDTSSKRKRRPSSQEGGESQLQDPKKIKTAGKESSYELSHHHRLKSASSNERRESRDSSCSSSKDKFKERDTTRPPTQSEEKDKDDSRSKENHHRSKDKSSSSSNSKDKQQHHSDQSRTPSEIRANSQPVKSSEQNSNKDRDRHRKEKNSPGKENVKGSKHHSNSGSSSSKSKSGSSNSHKIISSSSKERSRSQGEKHNSSFESESENINNRSSHNSSGSFETGTRGESHGSKSDKHEKRDSNHKRDRHRSGGGDNPGGSDKGRKDEQKRKKKNKEETDSSDSDEESKKKHHSIFEVVIDDYVSMYDKVKRSNRACKSNSQQQQQEKVKKQDKIKDQFRQLKQSRAKKIEKKRSTSVDESNKSFVHTSSDDEGSQMDTTELSDRKRDFQLDETNPSVPLTQSSEDEQDQNMNINKLSKSKSRKMKNKKKSSSIDKHGKKRGRKSSSKQSPSESALFHASSVFSNSDYESNASSSHLIEPQRKKKRSSGSVKSSNDRTPPSPHATKSSEDSMSDSEEEVSKVKNRQIKLEGQFQKKLQATDVYSDSDSSVESGPIRNQKPCVGFGKSKNKEKLSKQKSMKKSLFESSDSSDVDKSISTSLQECKTDKTRDSGYLKIKDKEGKSSRTKYRSHGSIGSSGLKSSKSLKKQKGERDGHGDTVVNKRESGSTMEDFLFGPMTSSSGSEDEKNVKPQPNTQELERPKTPTMIHTTIIDHNTNSDDQLRKPKVSPIESSERKPSLSPTSSQDLGAEYLESHRASSSTSEKKRKKHHHKDKKSKRQEADCEQNIRVSKHGHSDTKPDYDSLFNSPKHTSIEIDYQATPTPSALFGKDDNSTFSLSATCKSLFGLSSDKLTENKSILPLVKNSTDSEAVQTIPGMFSSDEDDDDDNKLKIEIKQVIMASDEPGLDSSELPDEKIDDEKVKLEEEEKKLHSLFEQDKAIESIVQLEEKSPPGSNPGDDEVIKDETLKECTTAISQEETEDAVAAILNLDGQDEENPSISIKATVVIPPVISAPVLSPPTIRIIEEAAAVVVTNVEPEVSVSPTTITTVSANVISTNIQNCIDRVASSIDSELFPVSSWNQIDSKFTEPEIKSSVKDDIKIEICLPKTPDIQLRKSSVDSNVSSGKDEKADEPCKPSSRRGSVQSKSRRTSNEGSADIYEFHDDSDDEKNSKRTQLQHSRQTPPIQSSAIRSPMASPPLPMPGTPSPALLSPTVDIPKPQPVTSPSIALSVPSISILEVFPTPTEGILPTVQSPMPVIVDNMVPKTPTFVPIPTIGIPTTVGRSKTPPSSILTPIRNTVDETIEHVIRMAASMPDPEPASLTIINVGKAGRRSRSRSKDSAADSDSTMSITKVINRPDTSPRLVMAQSVIAQSDRPPVFPLGKFEKEHGENNNESNSLETLIDPQTGILMPMLRQSDEGQYVPIVGQGEDTLVLPKIQQLQFTIPSFQSKTEEPNGNNSNNCEIMQRSPFNHLQLRETLPQVSNQKNEGLAATIMQQHIFVHPHSTGSHQYVNVNQNLNIPKSQLQSNSLSPVQNQNLPHSNVEGFPQNIPQGVVFTSPGHFNQQKPHGIPAIPSPIPRPFPSMGVNQQLISSPPQTASLTHPTGPGAITQSQVVTTQPSHYQYAVISRSTDVGSVRPVLRQVTMPISVSTNVHPNVIRGMSQPPPSAHNQSEISNFQIPKATTITKVNTGEEDRKQAAMQHAHSGVILQSHHTNLSMNAPGNGNVGASPPSSLSMTHQQIQQHQAQQELFRRSAEGQFKNEANANIVRNQDNIGLVQPPRVDISGSIAQATAGGGGVAAASPKMGRPVMQHEQQGPSTSMHLRMPPHSVQYEAQMTDMRGNPSNTSRGSAVSPHYSPSQSLQQVYHSPHYLSVCSGSNTTSTITPTSSSYGMRTTGISGPDKLPQMEYKSMTPDSVKGNPNVADRGSRGPATSQQNHLPPHLQQISHVHPTEQRNADSPMLTSMYGGQRHVYVQPNPAHQAISKQTFRVMYSDPIERQQHSQSPSYPTAYVPGYTASASEGESSRVSSPYGAGPGAEVAITRRPFSPPPAHGRYSGSISVTQTIDAPSTERQRQIQVHTPLHVSHAPPQGDTLLMLLQRYPIMWQGLLALKNDNAACQMHFVSGNLNVARDSLPSNPDGSIPPLRISQRMRLEQTQLEGVARKMQMEAEHCILLALPCGRDHLDVLQQSNNLRNGFITYLQLKQAAGIVNIHHPITQQPAYVIHIFPSCDFANENLARIAPDLLHGVADIAHLLIVIATV